MKTKCQVQIAGPAYDVQKVVTKNLDIICVFKVKTWKKLANGEEKKDFWKVVAFAKAAISILEVLSDGKFIIVDGEMDTYRENGIDKFQVKLREFFLFDTSRADNPKELKPTIC